MSFNTSPLSKAHNKKDFECGKGLLDNYLRIQAKQDVSKRLAACFVYVDEKSTVLGYYTLSNASIEKDLIPDGLKKKFPYEDVPVTLLGRLACDQICQGKGIGKLLLIDALKRSYETSKTVVSTAVVVDPIDGEGIRFYEKYGFILLPDSGKMFISMKTVSKLFS